MRKWRNAIIFPPGTRVRILIMMNWNEMIWTLLLHKVFIQCHCTCVYICPFSRSVGYHTHYRYMSLGIGCRRCNDDFIEIGNVIAARTEWFPYAARRLVWIIRDTWIPKKIFRLFESWFCYYVMRGESDLCVSLSLNLTVVIFGFAHFVTSRLNDSCKESRNFACEIMRPIKGFRWLLYSWQIVFKFIR